MGFNAQLGRHQEDFYAYATLSLDPGELQQTVKQAHHTNWDPEAIGPLLSRQVVFLGIYDGQVTHLFRGKIQTNIFPAMGDRLSLSFFVKNYMASSNPLIRGPYQNYMHGRRKSVGILSVLKVALWSRGSAHPRTQNLSL